MALDCEYAQGFYFYRPMTPEAVGALVDRDLRIPAAPWRRLAMRSRSDDGDGG